jgi:hypothetical protein
MLNRLRGRPHTPGDEQPGRALIGLLVCNLPFFRRFTHCFLLVVSGVLAGTLEPLLAGKTISSATAEELATGPAMASGPISFDIPSQPLAMALRAYSGAARVAVLVDGELTAGRHSAPVSGTLSREVALRSLLLGTGLTVRYATPAAFTLVSMAALDSRSNSRDYRVYFLAVQTALTQLLCQNEQTRPGHYRMALQLWIDQSGSVARSEFLSLTGIRERDTIIADSLKKMAIEMSQPAGLPQPVTVVVFPRASGQDTECAPRVTGSQR